jgi:hypothetical protein
MEKRGFSREQAAEYVGLPRASFDDRVRAGLIAVKYQGSKPTFLRERLDAYLDALPDEKQA